MKEKILPLAIKLYLDLPFWKRWRVRRFYWTNNWDVSSEWEKCLHSAKRMVEESEVRIMGWFPPVEGGHK